MTDYTGESAVDYFFHHDGMGSIVNITGSDETLMTTYDYGPFGDFTTTYHNGAIDSPFTYTGREFSAVKDMFHYRARNYMPEIGRFMSRDPYPYNPILPNTIQRYNYCGNSAVNFVDPLGKVFNREWLTGNEPPYHGGCGLTNPKDAASTGLDEAREVGLNSTTIKFGSGDKRVLKIVLGPGHILGGLYLFYTIITPDFHDDPSGFYFYFLGVAIDQMTGWYVTIEIPIDYYFVGWWYVDNWRFELGPIIPPMYCPLPPKEKPDIVKRKNIVV